MKKTVLLMIAALLGTNARAGSALSTDRQTNETKSQQAAALSYLIQSGAARVAKDGTVEVDHDLVGTLKKSGLIELTSDVSASIQCFEATK